MNLQEAINILSKVGQQKSYGQMFLMKNLANLHFLRRQFDQCEKVLLLAKEMSKELNGENEQNKFLN